MQFAHQVTTRVGKKVAPATLAYTEKTRRWKDEVMERGKAVYHSTHSSLGEDFEHSGTAEDYVPTHDLSLKKYSTKSRKVTAKSGWRQKTCIPALPLLA